MAFFSLIGSKVILGICNFLLLACGFCLITAGMLLLVDADRILLSRLLTSGPLALAPHPFLYYVAIGLASLGLVLASTGIMGCWASCIHSYILLTAYFLIILLLVVGECAVYAVGWAWPSCLGLGVNEQDLTKNVQGKYGMPGEDQFTAAVDLAQVLFECCGVESANEYDTSLWRLQSMGPSLAIPLTCCTLQNSNESAAYLNPVPVNSSLCQALEPNRHEGYRHLKGCNDDLQQWFRQHYLIFLGIGLVVVLVEFLVLLSTILTCTRIYKHNQDRKGIVEEEPQVIAGPSSERSFQRKLPPSAYSNDTYAMSNSFRHNYKLVDRI